MGREATRVCAQGPQGGSGYWLYNTEEGIGMRLGDEAPLVNCIIPGQTKLRLTEGKRVVDRGCRRMAYRHAAVPATHPDPTE